MTMAATVQPTVPPADRSTVPSADRDWRPGVPLLAALTGWVALFSWSPMVTEPGRFLAPALFAGLVMSLVGSGLRLRVGSAYVVAGAQLLTGVLFLNAVGAARQSLATVLPTVASVGLVAKAIGNGAATLNAYSAPVEQNAADTRALLLACALAVLWSVDVLAVGLRRPSMAAIPLLVALSVPVSILREDLAVPVFAGTALLFLRLLSAERFAASSVRAGTWWQVAVGAVVLALLAAPLVPVTDLLHRNGGGGGSVSALGNGFDRTGVNPFIHLRRDLVAQTHTPLVYAETKAPSTSYLRTTVLDEFTSSEWRPSRRILPDSNSANGVFPSPPGLAAGLQASEDVWSLQVAPEFLTTWLPLPYPIRELEVPGSWRYDARTLDVSLVGATPSPLRYRATAFTPAISAKLLLQSRAAVPAQLLQRMTELPKNFPSVITRRARELTRGDSTNFEKAVALQDWFRQGGGFRYSLEQRSGSGLDLLAAFVTDDRVGYCEQFAAAMAAMGRVLGIPSRVVVGFLNGTQQQDGRILYTSDDRHAWPEMYFSGAGWVRFEPTPGERAGVTPPWTRQSTQTPLQSALPNIVPNRVPAARKDQAAAKSRTSQNGGASIPWQPVATLLAVLLLGFAPAAVRRVQRRRRLASHDIADLAEGAWAELRATALDLGLDWPERRSPREQARRVVAQVPAENSQVVALEGLLIRVERGRYGPGERPGTLAGEPSRDVGEQLRTQTAETVRVWRQAMCGSVNRERGWRGRILPASLRPRRR